MSGPSERDAYRAAAWTQQALISAESGIPGGGCGTGDRGGLHTCPEGSMAFSSSHFRVGLDPIRPTTMAAMALSGSTRRNQVTRASAGSSMS